ncbi:MAG: Asp-tRNA(Asn)/Glu-tRNA(Gln) amidotransferase subunit GatC [Kiloniellales bacterium]|nr:Asp-tRNA(Asn)/Glu-tRNA(Gln) amidotransferase subunit GatC [Kiloniellales bacterium]
MSVDRDTVAQIAKLARIRIEAEQMEPLAAELSNILGWIEQLNELDTEGVAPMTSVVEVEAPLRKDAVTDGDCRDQVLANAPEAAEGFFLVPKVVE